jgi:hypothetical protein
MSSSPIDPKNKQQVQTAVSSYVIQYNRGGPQAFVVATDADYQALMKLIQELVSRWLDASTATSVFGQLENDNRFIQTQLDERGKHLTESASKAKIQVHRLRDEAALLESSTGKYASASMVVKFLIFNVAITCIFLSMSGINWIQKGTAYGLIGTCTVIVAVLLMGNVMKDAIRRDDRWHKLRWQ